MNMTPEIKELRARLAQCRRRRRLGLMACEILRWLGYALLALTIYAVADFFLAFSTREIRFINAALVTGLSLAALGRLIWRWRLPWRRMATICDRSGGDARQEILGAYELSLRARTDRADDALETYLVRQSIERAVTRLRALSWRMYGPVAELKTTARRLALQLFLAVLVLGAPWPVSRVVLSRIFKPGLETPPFSRYLFSVSPEKPEVLYGGTIEISVDIAGPAVQDAVWLVTRNGRNEQRVSCFQESTRRFSQRLEKVVQPMEFCFATGRARSRWQSLQVLLDPQIAAAQIRLVPPAYSRLPLRQFMAGEGKLAGLKGSAVEMEVTCNRPLLRGALVFRAGSDSPETATVEGELTNPHQVRFRWTLKESARFEVFVYDVRGTRNQNPMVLEQQQIPDEPPSAVMTAPAAFALATPKARIPISGEAEDDLGLLRVELVRSLAGFRDRAATLGPDAPEKTVTFERELDLGRLGVTPGDELEFYLEAFDSNPESPGIGASEIVRLQIISEEEYARHLRIQVHTEEIMARYRKAMEALQSLQRETEKLESDLRAGRLSEQEKATRWQQLAELNKKTADLFRAMSEELALFDIETGFQQELGKTVEMLEEQQAWLDKMPPFEEGLSRTLANILDRIGRQAQPLAREQKKAEDVAKISRLLEEALHYKALLRDQQYLVRRLEREIEGGRRPDPQIVRHLQKRQLEISRGLAELRDALRAKAAPLDDSLETLRQTAIQFADDIDRLEILPVMAEAVQAAENQDGAKMFRQSSLALERMEQLLSECRENAFGAMSECELKFQVRRDLQATLEQMMNSWSMGGGGEGSDGYSMQGYSPLNVPAYGPSRAGPEALEGRGRDTGALRKIDVDADAQERIRIPPRPGMERGAPPDAHFPEKYRAALRKYFQPTENGP